MHVTSFTGRLNMVFDDSLPTKYHNHCGKRWNTHVIAALNPSNCTELSPSMFITCWHSPVMIVPHTYSAQPVAQCHLILCPINGKITVEIPFTPQMSSLNKLQASGHFYDLKIIQFLSGRVAIAMFSKSPVKCTTMPTINLCAGISSKGLEKGTKVQNYFFCSHSTTFFPIL